MRDPTEAGRSRLHLSLEHRSDGNRRIAEIVKGGYPDPTAFDPKDSHYDPKSKPESPSWYGGDVKAVNALPEILTPERLRGTKGLEKMVLLQKGSTLSVQPS